MLIFLPVTVWSLVIFFKELIKHPFGNVCEAVVILNYRLIEFFVFDAVKIDRGAISFDDVLNRIHSFTVCNHHYCLIAVKDEPQHQRQKQVSHAPKEQECCLHSIVLGHVFVE